MAASPDILIVGGGITGLSAAYECAKAGARVALIEARRLGAMASTWTLGGVRQSGRDPAELPLAIAAVRRWGGLADDLGAETGYRRKGNLRLARTGEEVEVIRQLVETQKRAGLDIRFLPDAAAIAAIAPAIGAGALAASFCADDGHADPDATIAAYASAARQFGVALCEGVPAQSLLVENGRIVGVQTPEGPRRAQRVIVACGVHAPALLGTAGIALPMSVQRVSVVQTEVAPPSFEQVFGVANADCAGRQEVSGRFRYTTGIGPFPAGAEGWSEASLRPSDLEVAALKDRVFSVLPVVARLKAERVWGGLIDLTPDALPVLDAPEAHPGLVIGAGFSGHGFGIGPVSGAILKALAFGEAPGFDLAPFRLARFKPASGFAPLTLHG